MPRRLRPKFSGLFHDESRPDSYWIREAGTLQLPPLDAVANIRLRGEILPADPNDPTSAGPIGLALRLNRRVVLEKPDLPTGPFVLEFAPPKTARPDDGDVLELHLQGTRSGNRRAWLGRVTGLAGFQPWRRQAKNRRLRIMAIECDGEAVFDFSNRSSPWRAEYARRFLKVGLNLAGFFRADLGIGESVRCAARSADAADLPVSLIDLRLPCKNPLGDSSFVPRLQLANPHPVNVIHVDAPAMADLDHHHGTEFRRGKYNIGYWAWELPEFPDAWIPYAGFCDEVWAPSRFAVEAIAEKVPVPVLVMPHSISFSRPEGDHRTKFGLPADRFLFLFIYDLNSYSERKNPGAVIEAFRASGLAGANAALVIKVHNVPGNEADFERLRSVAATLPGTVLITQTLTRREIYELESACNCFVSLHRSEGFGLAIAECMYLGKPVIATNWSAPAEYLDDKVGCPVKSQLVTLQRSHGPYSKGQTWAEPDRDHAAWWMRRIVEDIRLARELGAAGRDRIERQFSPTAIGARYRRRLEAIAGW
ncbi:MAG TPA: glycosyltransferase family 4 protein [Candidatus Didemnitutus sp.]|nr:glycosyltransferase family 4 protein [Candidatus Didemnitutus sp.]